MNAFSYRRAAVEGTSSVGLVIMLYDRLGADLRRAAEAIREEKIEARCAEIKHAMLILQQLEGSLDYENGGQAARNLQALYQHARQEIMEAQARLQPQRLEKLIERLAEVAAAWREVDPGRNTAAAPEPAALSCSV